VLWLARRTKIKLSPMRTGTVLERAVLVPAFIVAIAVCVYLNTEARTALDPLVDRLLSLG
jgi:hypothetical protein